MPTVFNVGNSYNINNKKISSKLTFESGEKFSGKIIRSEDNNEVTIRLIDGVEFNAEMEGDISNLERGFQKFQVDGFEDGKLKLKIISKDIGDNSKVNSEFSDLILSEGLKSEDVDLLKSMIKFNIPLSKENIKEIKGLINFLNKLQNNSNEGNEFISKYLLSKGIDEESLEGQNIKTLLDSFLKNFKTLSKEDILLFFENNIEFNSRNIEGYKRVFEGDNKLLENINIIKKEINEINNSPYLKLKSENNLDNIEVKEINIKNNNLQEAHINESNEALVDNKLANGIYQKSEGTNRVNLLSLLKSLSGYKEDYLNTALKDVLISNKSKFTNIEFDKAYNIIENMKAEEFVNAIKDISIKNSNMTKYESKLNFELKFSNSDVEVLISKELGKNIRLTDIEFSKIKDAINLKNEEIIFSDNSIKDNNINEDINFNTNKGNIIKDEINSNNEMDLKNKVNLNGEIDLNDKEIKLSNLINRVDAESLNKDIIKESINKIGESNKEALEEIINTLLDLKEDGIISEKIVNFLKNNINEIKLFNKLSLEYYYADIPININEREYPCKIIIKDKRKDNKRIDSSNVKMIITIDTKNLGTIDGYMKVIDKKIDIDLKCEEEYISFINNSKNKLMSTIESMGFLVRVNVSKKENEVTLANCREFFNEGFGISLDRMV